MTRISLRRADLKIIEPQAGGPHLPLVDHLEELRRRLFIGLGTVAALTLLAMVWAGALLDRLASAVPGGLIFVRPAEAFFARMKIAVTHAFAAGLPVLLWQAWRFVSAGLTDEERRRFGWVVPAAYGLFLLGAGFAWLVTVPVAVRVLLGMGTASVKPLISVDAYLSFIVVFLLGFGAMCQWPLVVWVLAKVGIVTPAFLREYRPHAIVAIFILAGVLTPGPDVLSQLLMAGPGVLLYEASIWMAGLASRRPLL